MNFLRGKAAAGKVVLDAGPIGRRTGQAARYGSASGPSISVSASPDAPLAATVDVVENLGGTRYLYATTRSGENLVVEAREQTGVKAGDTVAARRSGRTGRCCFRPAASGSAPPD